jgi:drug/metabolite transporter (DMT)-like permease
MTEASTDRRHPRAAVLFAAVSVVWGIPYLLIRIAIDDGVPPVFLAWARIALGAAALLMVVPWRDVARALRSRLRWIAGFALAELVLPFPLIAIGEQHVASSLAAILIATAPLFVALLALRFDASERVSGRRLIGLVLGLAGVGALIGIDISGRIDELLGGVAILVAALCYAVGPMVLGRKLGDLETRISMTASLIVATLALAPAAATQLPTALPSATALAALFVLGLVCTAAGLVLYGMLVTEVGAGRSLVVTYLNPLIAVGLGIAVLGERAGAGTVAGLILILVGSYLSTVVKSKGSNAWPSSCSE